MLWFIKYAFLFLGYPKATVDILKSQIQSARVYLKTDYKLHIGEASRVPDHCIMYALADGTPSCDHAHDLSCERCDEIVLIFDTIQSAVGDANVYR